MNLTELLGIIDQLALGVFAVSGALAAAEKRLDILGFILFGTITGIGGGTTRDLLLDVPVFWVVEPRYLVICIAASVFTWFLARQLDSIVRALRWADAVGLALFSVLGTAKALDLNFPPIVAVVMGMMTASFGSLIRDGLIGRQPVLLEPEIYVTAALLGASVYIGLSYLPLKPEIAQLIAMASAFSLRAAAIVYDLRLPKYDR